MWIISIFLVVVFAISGYFGTTRVFMLDKLNSANVLNGILGLLVLFTLQMIAYSLGYFPQSVAAPFMMFLYTTAAGFFFGYAYRLFRSRTRSGSILYQHRSFWVDHAPNLLASVLILYGFYRTSVLTDLPVTGIRLTSGLSLIGFGMFSWTLKAVPEFRSKGVLLLDRFIPWVEVISWHWQGESVLSIEYFVEAKSDDKRIKQFTTSIPEEDRKEVESLLNSKMDPFDEEHRSKLLKSDED